MSSDGKTWLPIAGAGAIAAVVLTVVLTLGGGENRGATPQVTSTGALVCPSTFQQSAKDPAWVPNKPYGLDGSKALVPDQAPKHVVVCAYLGASGRGTGTTAVPLSGHKELTGNLAAVTRSLAGMRATTAGGSGACNQTNRVDDYLIGLTYSSGTQWLSAPGSPCAGASNGSFTTKDSLRDPAAAAYAAGTWPVPR